MQQTHRKITIDDLDFYVNMQTGEAGVSLRGLASWLNQPEITIRRKLENSDEGLRYLTPVTGKRTKTGARVRYIPLQAAEAFASLWGLTPKLELQPLLERLISAMGEAVHGIALQQPVERPLGNSISLTQVVRDLGHADLVATGDGCKHVGKLVKQHYLEVHGKEPPRKAAFYNGMAGTKPAYYESDRQVIEEAIQPLVQQQWNFV